MTLSVEILKLMRERDTFTIWGFTTMSYREVATILKKHPISISNCMRALAKKEILICVGSLGKGDMYSDTGYKLVNKE